MFLRKILICILCFSSTAQFSMFRRISNIQISKMNLSKLVGLVNVKGKKELSMPKKELSLPKGEAFNILEGFEPKPKEEVSDMMMNIDFGQWKKQAVKDTSELDKARGVLLGYFSRLGCDKKYKKSLKFIKGAFFTGVGISSIYGIKTAYDKISISTHNDKKKTSLHENVTDPSSSPSITSVDPSLSTGTLSSVFEAVKEKIVFKPTLIIEKNWDGNKPWPEEIWTGIASQTGDSVNSLNYRYEIIDEGKIWKIVFSKKVLDLPKNIMPECLDIKKTWSGKKPWEKEIWDAIESKTNECINHLNSSYLIIDNDEYWKIVFIKDKE